MGEFFQEKELAFSHEEIQLVFPSQAFHAVLEKQRLSRSFLEEEENIRTTEAMAMLCQVRGLRVGPAENPPGLPVLRNPAASWAGTPKIQAQVQPWPSGWAAGKPHALRGSFPASNTRVLSEASCISGALGIPTSKCP